MRQRSTTIGSLLAVLAALVPLARPAIAATAATAPGFVYAGLYESQWEAGEELDAFAGWAGRRATLSGTFHTLTENQSWSENTKTILEERWDGKSTPFANVTSDKNLAVTYNDIKPWAMAVKSWLDLGGGRSLIVAPFQEMNGSWVGYGCNPSGFKSAYALFRQVFADLGMDETQVRWAFAPNGYTSPGCGGIADYYPGAASVDIVGFSSYNYGPKNWDGRYWTPAEVFGPWINEIKSAAPGKPILIAQTGTAPEGGDRDAWLREMFTYLANDPAVVAVIYFNIDKRFAGGNEFDWRVWSGGRDAPGFQDGMQFESTAYAWPLASWFQPGPLSFGNVDRAAGPSRVETAVEISKKAFTSATTAVLAPSREYAHALLGGPLAAKAGGPILLTPPDQVPDVVIAEMGRLGVTDVILVGNTSDLSPGLQSQLTSAGYAVDRISGTNVFDLSRLVAMRVGGDDAYVVEGLNADPKRGWPDAVSVSGLASYQQRPILFVEYDRLPPETVSAISSVGIDRAVVIGGTAAVSQAVEDAIAGQGVTMQPRLAGADRYGTSYAVAEASVAAGMDPAKLWIATGTNYPDALAAGAGVARTGGVLILANGNRFERSPQVGPWLSSRTMTYARLVGGPVALAPHVEGAALGLAAG